MIGYLTIVLLTGLCGVCAATDEVLCYQCANSIDNEDSHCINGIQGLAAQRTKYQRGIELKHLPNIKNCSLYVVNGRPLYPYCKLERIHSYGTVNAYIRDCSTGTDFPSLNISRLAFATADNQTVCGYSQLQGATVCVTLCTGILCNGPFGGCSLLTAPSTLMVVLTMAALSFRR